VNIVQESRQNELYILEYRLLKPDWVFGFSYEKNLVLHLIAVGNLESQLLHDESPLRIEAEKHTSEGVAESPTTDEEKDRRPYIEQPSQKTECKISFSNFNISYAMLTILGRLQGTEAPLQPVDMIPLINLSPTYRYSRNCEHKHTSVLLIPFN
jgi:hypothetical protein